MKKKKSTQPEVSFTSKRGWRLMGLNFNTDGAVKGFFGGNAYLAIIFLLFICIFLFKSAIGFIPGYRTELSEARISGIEASNHVNYQLVGYDALYTKINQAFINERRARFGDLETVVPIYEEFESIIDDKLEDEVEEFTDLDDDEKTSASEALKKAVADACATLSKDALLKKIQVRLPETNEITDKAYQQAIGYAQQYAMHDAETPEAVDKIPAQISAQMGDFNQAVEAIKKSDDALREVFNNMEKQANHTYKTLATNRKSKEGIETLTEAYEDAEKNKPSTPQPTTKERIQSAQTILADDNLSSQHAAAQKALEQAQKDLNEGNITWAEKQAIRLKSIAASKANIKEIDTEKNIKTIYAAIESHDVAADKMVAEFQAGLDSLENVEISTEKSKLLINDAKELFVELKEIVTERKKKLAEWKHDKPVTMMNSISAFFLGTDWKTNSDRQSLYGLVPLFSGSLLISLVAMVIAVPLAVGAAVYVNQFAQSKEAGLLKPAIEFIQAIPSVVLGLFGVLVVSGLLQTLSQCAWLSWVPGFPITNSLNVFLAGLLLAFMAAPTIFTLAEDALNNVPKAYSEASLAMGATKLQTATKIIVPASLSGIIAAIMLGFGRVIGETMVVLLVAGNAAKMPDLSKGLGVLGEPVHTMTGIIAQEYGELEPGVLHWEALFMVGLVLFLISLSINSVCQRVISKKAK